MYDLGWEVADRTRRLLDLAEGIRQERELRDGRPKEVAAQAVAADDVVVTPPTDAPAMPRTTSIDCPSKPTASRPHAA